MEGKSKPWHQFTKDIGYHRSAATNVITVDVPDAHWLSVQPPSLTGTGFHRNGLDRYNAPVFCAYIQGTSLFTAATLAHNSDFIEEVLPAISKRILTEHPDVKLIIGNWKLPTHFLARFELQVVRVPWFEASAY
jgi:hypothetical protein